MLKQEAEANELLGPINFKQIIYDSDVLPTCGLPSLSPFGSFYICIYATSTDAFLLASLPPEIQSRTICFSLQSCRQVTNYNG
jgi:hypothetical protein